MSKMGKIYGKITHFRHFWAILPILVGKRITDLNGFKKTRVKFIKTFICDHAFEIWDFGRMMASMDQWSSKAQN
jgi:hypothetical protein